MTTNRRSRLRRSSPEPEAPVAELAAELAAEAGLAELAELAEEATAMGLQAVLVAEGAAES